MFTINQGFDLNSPQFNFKRDYFASVADLEAAPETSFPDHFITNVAGVLYQLTKSNSVDPTTGKWRKVQLGSDVDLSDYVTKENAVTNVRTVRTSDGKTQIRYEVNGEERSADLLEAAFNSNGVMSAADKAKLDGIAANANNYTLPTATTTALGGIKLGSGLSATSDGTVSVSKDIVAGSVEWNNIKNKPNVAILSTDGIAANTNNGYIAFQTENHTGEQATIGYVDNTYSVSVTLKAYNNVSTTRITSDGLLVSNYNESNDHNYNNVKVGANGITLTTAEGVPSNCVFMTDGTTELITAISTEELNKIFV